MRLNWTKHPYRELHSIYYNGDKVYKFWINGPPITPNFCLFKETTANNIEFICSFSTLKEAKRAAKSIILLDSSWIGRLIRK